MYPELVYTRAWREQRARAATTAHRETALTADDFWRTVWPELYGQVELDLAQTGLITDLDGSLRSHTVHFVAAAIERVARIDTTWTRKAVADVVRRRESRLQDPHPGPAGR